jgi:hypothetical protein
MPSEHQKKRAAKKKEVAKVYWYIPTCYLRASVNEVDIKAPIYIFVLGPFFIYERKANIYLLTKDFPTMFSGAFLIFLLYLSFSCSVSHFPPVLQFFLKFRLQIQLTRSGEGRKED